MQKKNKAGLLVLGGKDNPRYKHGGSGDPLYRVWQGMWDRCSNPRHVHYRNYGGRGIAVCAPWRDYATFRQDMGERPVGFTLDRIDNNGPYSPSNCRWASRYEQAQNKRNFRPCEAFGVRSSVSSLARLFGITASVLSYRTKKFGSTEDALLSVGLPLSSLCHYEVT